MRICVLGNQARAVFLFWRVLMQKMLAQGHSVVCLVPPGDEENNARLRALGIELCHYRLDRKGLNPLRDIQTFLDFHRFFRRESIDLLFATTIKPVIYGCAAARLARVPHIYATITGLGYAFEADTPAKKLIHLLSVLLYRAALSGAEGVFFQNRDDAGLFRTQGILRRNARVLFARGTGVDTARFTPQPLPDDSEGLVFLVVCRLLVAKGLREYAEAAARVRRKYPNARFRILGPREHGPGSIGEDEIRAWQAGNDVEYLGGTSDVVPYVRACHVVVLPSWREGTPTAVMEAMSMGRACLVTDVPGCREVVEEGRNGFLVPVKNPEALARAMERFLADPALARRMGEAGRRLAEEKFDARVVASGILRDMHIPERASEGAHHD